MIVPKATRIVVVVNLLLLLHAFYISLSYNLTNLDHYLYHGQQYRHYPIWHLIFIGHFIEHSRFICPLILLITIALMVFYVCMAKDNERTFKYTAGAIIIQVTVTIIMSVIMSIYVLNSLVTIYIYVEVS